VFGPHPRHYTVKVNRKARRAALRSALSIHAQRGSVAVLDAGVFETPSTRQAKTLLEGRLGGSVLVVLGDDDFAAAKSFRNLAAIQILHVDDVGVADVVGASVLVMSRDAVDVLSARAQRPERRVAAVEGEVV
jgi:large subunit ribosomal protein L4